MADEASESPEVGREAILAEAEEYRLGEWRVRPRAGLVRRNGEERHLAPQQMDLLVYLSAHHGRVVTKEEIFAVIWRGVEVEEVALPRLISELRRTLGDDARRPRYIQTFPKKGYSVIAPMRLATDGAAGDGAAGDGAARDGAPRDGAARDGAAGDGAARDVAASNSADRDSAATDNSDAEPDAGPSGRRQRPGRSAALALALVAVAAGAVVVTLRSGLFGPGSGRDGSRPAPQGPAAEAARPPAVAVLGFANLSGDPAADWLATALSEVLGTELALSRQLRVIPGETVARLKQELAIADAESLAPATLTRLRAGLGADYVVVGSVLTVRGEEREEIRMDVRVQASASGDTIAAFTESGASARILDLVSLTGIRLREALGAEDGGERLGTKAAHLPANPEALRLYFDGLRRLRRFEASQARELLEGSLEAEPDQPLANLALAEAWARLGYEVNALEAAERAVETSASLPREERLWIEAKQMALRSQWAEAIELHRALWIFSPDNLEYGLALAEAQNSAGRPQAALATLEEIREQTGPDHQDPRFELVAADSARRVGDQEGALASTLKAIEMGTELGASVIIARGRYQQAEAFHALGREAEAVETLGQARAAFSLAGDHSSEARTQATLAGWLSTRGDFAAAKDIAEKALAVFREIGDRLGEADVLRRLAVLDSEGGDLTGAERLFRKAIEVYAQTGDRSGEAKTLNDLAVAMAAHGRFGDAKPLFERSLVLYRAVGNRERTAMALANLGRLHLIRMELVEAAAKLGEAEQVLRELGLEQGMAMVLFNHGQVAALAGEPAAAADAFEEAVSLFRGAQNQRMVAAGLNGLGEALLAQKEIERARSSLKEALALRLEMGHLGRIVDSRLALTALLVEAGEAQAAEEMARQVVTTAESEGSAFAVPDHKRSIALGLLAGLLLDQGRVADASAVMAQAEELMSPDLAMTSEAFQQSITGARVQAATGDVEGARARLAEVLRKTADLGVWSLNAWARLGLGEMELSAGDIEAAGRLAALEAEARQRGWILIADKARAARAASPSPDSG